MKISNNAQTFHINFSANNERLNLKNLNFDASNYKQMTDGVE